MTKTRNNLRFFYLIKFLISNENAQNTADSSLKIKASLRHLCGINKFLTNLSNC